MITIKRILDKKTDSSLSFRDEFNTIILNQCENYGKDKKALKSFLEDMQKGGCISGMIGDFVYHNDCKAFYIKHIDDLEEFKSEYESELGEAVRDRNSLPHYTFICWFVFEEYCYRLYNEVFEQD